MSQDGQISRKEFLARRLRIRQGAQRFLDADLARLHHSVPLHALEHGPTVRAPRVESATGQTIRSLGLGPGNTRSFLELGCGSAYMARTVARMSIPDTAVICMDVAADLVEHLNREHFDHLPNARAVAGHGGRLEDALEARRLSPAQLGFDIVVVGPALGHRLSPASKSALLRRLETRLVKPGGLLVVSIEHPQAYSGGTVGVRTRPARFVLHGDTAGAGQGMMVLPLTDDIELAGFASRGWASERSRGETLRHAEEIADEAGLTLDAPTRVYPSPGLFPRADQDRADASWNAAAHWYSRRRRYRFPPSPHEWTRAERSARYLVAYEFREGYKLAQGRLAVRSCHVDDLGPHRASDGWTVSHLPLTATLTIRAHPPA